MKKICVGLLFFTMLYVMLAPSALAGQGTVYEVMDASGAQYDECVLGDLTADAVRYSTGADVALVGGGLLRANLPYGEPTDAVLCSVYTGDEEIFFCTLSPVELYEIFEVSVSREVQLEIDGALDGNVSAFAGFLQISGLCLVWDASAPMGERVYSLEDEDGTVLDRTAQTPRYTVAVTADLLTDGYGYAEILSRTAEAKDQTLFSCVQNYADVMGELKVPEGGRIYVRAVNRDKLVESPMFVVVAMVVLVLAAALTNRVKIGQNNRY